LVSENEEKHLKDHIGKIGSLIVIIQQDRQLSTLAIKIARWSHQMLSRKFLGHQ
jgi:hypothetical protein